MRRFYRSRSQRVLGGVCGGVAEYFNVDPSLVRLFWIIAACAGGGVLAYILAWLIVPTQPTVEAATSR